MNKFALWTLALTLCAGLGSVRAEDDRLEFFKEKANLSEDAPFDKKTNTHHKVHDVKLAAGQFIHVELKSGDFRPLLRVIGPTGKNLFEDAKSGQNVRVVKIDKEGSYQFVVAGATKEKSGDYVLTVARANLKDRADLLRSQVVSLTKVNGAAQDGFLRDFKQLLVEKADKIETSDVQLAFKACRDLEFRGDVGAIYEEVIALMGKAPKTAEPLVNIMKGVTRRTPGHEISVLTGTTTKGEEFNWKSFHGKVVLIDFWATWCGPCRVELPNVLKLYDKYHAQGFEVVGISLDRDRKALDKYIEDQKLPWLCLHEDNNTGSHPMARLYGLQFIPLPILVGRDGKVVSMRARGPELARLLEKHIASK